MLVSARRYHFLTKIFRERANFLLEIVRFRRAILPPPPLRPSLQFWEAKSHEKTARKKRSSLVALEESQFGWQKEKEELEGAAVFSSRKKSRFVGSFTTVVFFFAGVTEKRPSENAFGTWRTFPMPIHTCKPWQGKTVAQASTRHAACPNSTRIRTQSAREHFERLLTGVLQPSSH